MFLQLRALMPAVMRRTLLAAEFCESTCAVSYRMCYAQLRIDNRPPAPAYQANTYNTYTAAPGPYAVANATYAPQAAAYSQMYGGERSMNLQAEWQNRLQGQDSHRSQQPSRTGTPGLSAVVAAQTSLHSPKREGGSDDGHADIKAENIQTAINGAVDESSRLYLSQQRNELLAMHQPPYYSASTTLPRLSSPNCKP